MLNFGSQLQRFLRENKMTQSELGRLVGATSQSVNGWCQSGVIPRSDILEQLPRVTGKPLFWFFMTEEESAFFSDIHSECTQHHQGRKTVTQEFSQAPKDSI
ncbi:helix-turn-helix transcriptional regulator [Serratia marcescens]|uniref:helix-turn-helix transcriptional regulator n=1 Tax=Serratia marcescens TaxID=615 RepID=UPI0032049BE8